jgi:fatty acid desaturase
MPLDKNTKTLIRILVPIGVCLETFIILTFGILPIIIFNVALVFVLFGLPSNLNIIPMRDTPKQLTSNNHKQLTSKDNTRLITRRR